MGRRVIDVLKLLLKPCSYRPIRLDSTSWVESVARYEQGFTNTYSKSIDNNDD